MTDQTNNKLGRREFLGAAAAAGFMIIKPQFVRGQPRIPSFASEFWVAEAAPPKKARAS